jgi:hypothetical protein
MKTNSIVRRFRDLDLGNVRLSGLGETGRRRLQSGFVAVVLCLNGVIVPGVSADELPDLKVTKVEIIPNNVLDARTSPVFKPDGILEVAAAGVGDAPQKTNSAPLIMRMYRSYRFIVTIQNSGKVLPSGSFLVRTEYVREGQNSVALGRTRFCMSDRVSYACFDVYPSELLVAEAKAAGVPLKEILSEAGKSEGMKGAGECLIRTIVDADNEVKESDEGASSNTLDFSATMQR